MLPTSRLGRGAITALLLLAAAGRGGADGGRNLLLVTVDTLRADALGINGAASGATPNLDRLARAGVNFTRARAPAPLTLPSHASILTATDPPTHGVRDNGAYRLEDGQPVLTELLRARGYATAAFVASFVLDRRFGLARGFEVYDDRVSRDPAQLERLEAERPAAAIVAAFESWLETVDPGRPFFAWVHLYDPHAPYEPPEPFRGRHAGDPYVGEVASADAAVGRVLDALARRGLLERTLVAVVGDHGEGLGEHGEATHSLLIYNSTLHVPMLLWAPGLLPEGVEVDDLVRIIDLAPTLLDLLGAGGALGDGVSLRPRLRAGGDAPAAAPLTAYGESLYGQLNLGWSPLYGLESGGFRFILAPASELYDLAADPGETRNLAAERPEVARRLRRQLLERVRAATRAPSPLSPEPADDEAAARLRSLGYLSGGGRRPSRHDSGVDPKSRIALWNRIQLATARFGRGEHAAAAAELEEILAAEPAMPLLYDYLGAAYVRLERWSQAERVYRAAVGRGLGSAAMHAGLGLLHARRGDTGQAETELRTALALDPASVVAHHRLGDLQRGRGRHRDAAESYRRALALNPDYVYAWNGLGMSLAAAGADEEALTAFRRAVEAAPAEARGQFNLAVQLERMDRLAEARAAYRQALDLARDDPDLARQAAAGLQRLGQRPG